MTLFGIKNTPLALLLLFLICVECQEDETTIAPESVEDVTTVEPITTTTTLAPLAELDFRMRPAGNFYIDVNFTEIRGEPNTVEMIVRLEASPNSEPSRYLCQGLLGIYLLQLPNCEGLDLSVPYEARKLTTLNKRVGEETLNVTDINISFLLTHNCLIVAAENSSYHQIFTTTTTTTTTTSAPDVEETTIPTLGQDTEADILESGRGFHTQQFHDESELHNDYTAMDFYDAEPETLESSRGFLIRKYRQLDEELDGNPELENGPLGQDYYDPEDISDDGNLQDEEREKDPDIALELGLGNPGVQDDRELDPKFGLDKRTLAVFRQEGCPAGKTFDRIPLLGSQPRTLSRSFFSTSFAIVLSSGSVGSGSSSSVSASSPGVVFFGNAGSFTFNPLANWPVVVLQGSYVLATYGVIIAWALILGAIVWGVSVSQFSNFFTAKRAGYVASELIYRPIERMTDLVYTGVEKFSELNRRNYKPGFKKPSAQRVLIPDYHFEEYGNQ